LLHGSLRNVPVLWDELCRKQWLRFHGQRLTWWGVSDTGADTCADAKADPCADARYDTCADTFADPCADARYDTCADAGTDTRTDSYSNATSDPFSDAASNAASDIRCDALPDSTADTQRSSTYAVVNSIFADTRPYAIANSVTDTQEPSCQTLPCPYGMAGKVYARISRARAVATCARRNDGGSFAKSSPALVHALSTPQSAQAIQLRPDVCANVDRAAAASLRRDNAATEESAVIGGGVAGVRGGLASGRCAGIFACRKRRRSGSDAPSSNSTDMSVLAPSTVTGGSGSQYGSLVVRGAGESYSAIGLANPGTMAYAIGDVEEPVDDDRGNE
jgi:hypothetical protein